jgi:HK97 family phage major capsid protein/HK97 family phage prohead protease
MAAMSNGRVRRALEGDSSLLATRAFPLRDIEILSRAKGGDGRTVVAYAAVFRKPVPIVDSDGDYEEQIDDPAFDRSVADRSRKIGVFYHHGRTLQGTPSDRGSVPLGSPVEPPRADGTGLLTVSRYNKTQLADDVLESIRNGDITGQSFTGVFLQSDPDRGPYYPSRSGQRTLVTRKEIALIEYGPTPFPAYQDAAIVGVRNREMLMEGEDDQPERTTVTIHVDHPQARAVPEPPAAHERTGVPVHHTDVVDVPWDAGENTSRLPDIKGRPDAEKYLAVYAWYDASGPDPDHDDLPDTRGSWKLPHHMVAADGTPGAANINGVRAALARAGQLDPPLSAGDETAVKAHLQAHMDDWHKDHPADSGGGQRTGTVPAAPVQPGPPTHPVTKEATTPEGGAMSDRQMTVDERAARLGEIKNRFTEIDTQFSGGVLDEAARSEWTDLDKERKVHEAAIEDVSYRATYLAALAERNPAATVPGADQGAGYGQDSGSRSQTRSYGRAPALNKGRPENLYDVASARSEARSLDDLGRVYRERAKWSIDEATFPGAPEDDAAVKGRLERLIAKVDEPDTLARNMLLTGSPEYRSAFGKLLISQNPAMLGQAEQRALQQGTPASWSPGSYPVPYQLDPTVILTSSGAINALRTISRVEQIVGKEWQGVTSAGITVTRSNELAAASDGAPTLGQPGVAPTRVQAFVPFSIETEQDWNGLMAEIAMMLADAKDVEEATTFLTGAGTGDIPQGVMTGIAGTAQQVTTAGTAAVAPGDVYALEDAIPPRFIDQAVMLASKTGYNTIRQTFTQLASSAGDPWSRPSQGQPAELLGYSAYQNSNMAGVLTSGSQILVLGDFRHFIIVDRIGMSVELVPHVFATGASAGTPAMPQGERGIYALWRNSSQVLVPNAFRFLQTR